MEKANVDMTHKDLDSLAKDMGVFDNEDYPTDGDKKEKVGYLNSFVKEEPVTAEPIPARIHINQFLVSYPDVTPMHRAGFLAFVGGKAWMREDEWKKAFKSYFKR